MPRKVSSVTNYVELHGGLAPYPYTKSWDSVAKVLRIELSLNQDSCFAGILFSEVWDEVERPNEARQSPEQFLLRIGLCPRL